MQQAAQGGNARRERQEIRAVLWFSLPTMGKPGNGAGSHKNTSAMVKNNGQIMQQIV
jgi:hypothetical protein